MSSAGEDGLDASRLLSLLPPSLANFTSVEPLAEEKRAEIDLILSLAAVAYAHDARGGRLEPAKLSAMLTPDIQLPPAGEVLERTAKAETSEAVREALALYNPQHEGYRALKQALARLRAEPVAEPETTASAALKPEALRADLPANFMEGGLLVPGQEDARVPNLRRRLGLPASEKPVYDVALADAVREFQRANGLKPMAASRRAHVPNCRISMRPSTGSRRPSLRRMIALARSSPIWSVGAGCRRSWGARISS